MQGGFCKGRPQTHNVFALQGIVDAAFDSGKNIFLWILNTICGGCLNC